MFRCTGDGRGRPHARRKICVNLRATGPCGACQPQPSLQTWCKFSTRFLSGVYQSCSKVFGMPYLLLLDVLASGPAFTLIQSI